MTNTMALSQDGFLYFGAAGSGVFRRPVVTYEDYESPESDYDTIHQDQGIGVNWIIGLVHHKMLSYLKNHFKVYPRQNIVHY